MHEHFINCKTLVAFVMPCHWHTAGEQPQAVTSGEKNVIIRRCPVLEMWEGAQAHKEPALTQVKLECCSVNPDPKGGTQLLLLQRAVKFTQRKVTVQQPVKHGLHSPEGPPDIPQLTVCAPGFHPVVIVPSPVTCS